MGIKIENFQYVTDPDVKKQEEKLDKEKYIEFLVNKGLEECESIVKHYESLKETIQDSAIGNTEELIAQLKVTDDAIFYYKIIVPSIIAGDYDSVSKYSSIEEETLAVRTRNIRRDLIAKLDEKYGADY